MKFTLHYRGPLKTNGRPKDKQKLRRHFHSQLKDLWCRPPLRDQREWLDKDYELNVLKEVDGWTFASIINAKHHLIATLNVTLLRPEDPGNIVTQGGDIDNRLKTLLDALTIPHRPQQIPKDDSPQETEVPFHCLLEDDSLVTGLTVTVDRLLGRDDDSDDDSSEVLMLIGVEVSVTRPTLENSWT